MQALALVSMHTSPLHQPGSGDAGGMNVYIANTAREIARLGVSVDIFTRADPADLAGAAASPGGSAGDFSGASARASSSIHPTAPQTSPTIVSPWPGVRVIGIPVGVGEPKNALPAYAEAFADSILADFGPYDAVHAHYWISGLAGQRLARVWNAPLLHTMHTLALVKELGAASGEPSEPGGRADAERQLIAAADRMIVNTSGEAADLVRLYGADGDRISVVSPGVDLETFTTAGRADSSREPGPVREADSVREAYRRAAGVPDGAFHLLFAGRIQRLKGPQVLVEAIALLPRDVRVHLSIVGAQSGGGELDLPALIAKHGLEDRVRLHPPVAAEELAEWYRSAEAVAMPSFAESFGLVALEAQACGRPVLAANVGGLSQAVSDGRTGLLIDGHAPLDWAAAIRRLATEPRLLAELSYAAPIHARAFGWQRTAMLSLQAYRAAAGA